MAAAAATRDPPRVQIDALMEELARERAKDPGVKSIVFSQFTQFLDLIEWCLQRNGASGAGWRRRSLATGRHSYHSWQACGVSSSTGA